MSGWMIALIVVGVIVLAVIIAIRIVKNKIRNKLIDKGAEVITKATGNVLDEKTAGIVTEVTNATAEVLKGGGGVTGLVTAAAKTGLKIAKAKRQESSSAGDSSDGDD